MKIAVLETPQRGVNNDGFFQSLIKRWWQRGNERACSEPWCDPIQYVVDGKHEIQHRTVHPEAIEEDVSKVEKEEFDMFVVSMWTSPKDSATGLKVVELLESYDKIVLGASSSSIRQDDFITHAGAKVSLGLEFPSGTKYSLFTISIGGEVVIFDPVECGQDTVGTSVVDAQLKELLVDAARSRVRSPELESKDRGGLVRVDFQVDHESQTAEVLSINRNPRAFSPNAVTVDDKLVERTVPGGHTALFDLLIASRVLACNTISLNQQVVDIYAGYSLGYDEEVTTFPYYRIMQQLVAKFDYSGTVMDLACGTGLLGNLLHEKDAPFEIVGVDLSPEMTASPAIRKYYQSPVMIGSIQAIMMQPVQIDHIACFGALVYLNEVDFAAVLVRMFMVARKSITFDIEDSSEVYMKKASEDSKLLSCYNHTKAWENFKVPAGWKVVYKEYGILYHDSHNTSYDMFDTMVRLEKFS